MKNGARRAIAEAPFVGLSSSITTTPSNTTLPAFAQYPIRSRDWWVIESAYVVSAVLRRPTSSQMKPPCAGCTGRLQICSHEIGACSIAGPCPISVRVRHPVPALGALRNQ
jgi:hypothetical protein